MAATSSASVTFASAPELSALEHDSLSDAFAKRRQLGLPTKLQGRDVMRHSANQHLLRRAPSPQALRAALLSAEHAPRRRTTLRSTFRPSSRGARHCRATAPASQPAQWHDLRNLFLSSPARRCSPCRTRCDAHGRLTTTSGTCSGVVSVNWRPQVASPPPRRRYSRKRERLLGVGCCLSPTARPCKSSLIRSTTLVQDRAARAVRLSGSWSLTAGRSSESRATWPAATAYRARHRHAEPVGASFMPVSAPLRAVPHPSTR